MDPVSQGLLGSSLASSFSQKQNLRYSALCGFVGGIAPDLDIFIRSSNDPLLSLDYHRHFSHSLFFTPIGGFLVAIFLFLMLKKKLSFKQIYIFSFLGYFSHGILDSLTSYGTNLFWPISDLRVSLNIISIIDPIFTFILLFFLILSLKSLSLFMIRLGLFISIFYLTFNIIKYQQVKNYVKDISTSREHKIDKFILKPSLGNNFLWRSVYQYKNKYFIDAIYFPLIGKKSFKAGPSVNVINKETVFPSLSKNSIQREDILRFSNFSQGFIYLHPDYDFLVADLRYGTLPYDDKSLWGVEIDLNNPNKHVVFKNIRNFDEKIFYEFWEMLKGNLN